jgi:hypothetical protein
MPRVVIGLNSLEEPSSCVPAGGPGLGCSKICLGRQCCLLLDTSLLRAEVIYDGGITAISRKKGYPVIILIFCVHTICLSKGEMGADKCDILRCNH